MHRMVPRLAFLLTILATSPSEAGKPQDGETLAVIHQVTGRAQIVTNGSGRPALPFTSLQRGDSVCVDSGLVSVFLRSGEEQILGSGSRYIVTEVPEPADTALWLQIVNAIKELFYGPRYRITGVTRGPGSHGVPVWPELGQFSVDSRILFQWPDSVEVGCMTLEGPLGAIECQRLIIEDPANPTEWPSRFPRMAGMYRWEIKELAAQPAIGQGDFEILTDAESNEVRGMYRTKVRGTSPSSTADILGEVLAAKDLCYLH